MCSYLRIILVKQFSLNNLLLLFGCSNWGLVLSYKAMDDPNYKMKNLYSSVSPSEIALRCTILDLCQRLKRTEVLCDYYEQCRNELVSDCIRLRQERDYYAMAHRNFLQKSEASKQKANAASNQNTGPILENQLSQTKMQPSFQFEREIDFSKASEPDESYEEIARRLIAQFREEMEEIRRTSINGQQVNSRVVGNNVLRARTCNHPMETSTMSTMIASPATPNSNNQREVSNYNDEDADYAGVSSKLLDTSDKSPAGNSLYMSKKQTDLSNKFNNSDYKEKSRTLADPAIGKPLKFSSSQGITKKDSSENNDRPLSYYDGSFHGGYQRNQPTGYQNRQRNVIDCRNEERGGFRDGPTVPGIDSNRDIHSSENNVNIGDSPSSRPGGDNGASSRGPSASTSDADQYIDLCNKLLKSSINDFDTLTRMLMNQNEKLRKLKGKQLRNYFRRQLDQNNENIDKRP